MTDRTRHGPKRAGRISKTAEGMITAQMMDDLTMIESGSEEGLDEILRSDRMRTLLDAELVAYTETPDGTEEIWFLMDQALWILDWKAMLLDATDFRYA